MDPPKSLRVDGIIDYYNARLVLEDFQDTAAPPIVKTYPLVDLVSFVSDIQLASLYPSSTVGFWV